MENVKQAVGEVWSQFKGAVTFSTIALTAVFWVLNSQEKAVSAAFVPLDTRITKVKEYADARDKEIKEDQVRMRQETLDQFRIVDEKLTMLLLRVPKPLAVR